MLVLTICYFAKDSNYVRYDNTNDTVTLYTKVYGTYISDCLIKSERENHSSRTAAFV